MKFILRILIALYLITIFMHYDHIAVAKDKMVKGYEPISLFNDRIRIMGTYDHIIKLRLHTLREERWARKSPLNMCRSNFSFEVSSEFFAIENGVQLNKIYMENIVIFKR